MPEISVIVPVYNGEKYIERCYDSIKNQTFQDFEIIFVDDGSTDNSFSILKKINNDKVKLISQENKKQGAARNTGLKAASGNYISFVDIDDFISEDFLEGLYNAVIKNSADISAVSIIRYKNEKNKKIVFKIENNEILSDSKLKYEKLYYGSGKSVWNKLYKKEFLIKNNLFFRENVFYEDTDFSIKAIYYANKIALSNKGNYFYFVNNNSTIRMFRDKQKQNDKYIGLKLACEFALENGLINKKTINRFDYNFLGINFLRIKETLSLNKKTEEGYLFDLFKVYSKNI